MTAGINLKEEIKNFFKGEVLDDEETLGHFSRDASLFEVRPQLVVVPKDIEDLKKLVKFVSSEKKKGRDLSLTARGAGTDMTGGPLSESIIIDFTKHLNQIKELSRTRAIVEPGLLYRDLEREMDKLGVMVPSYPASKNLCAVGGMVANNSGGEKTLAYGKTEKFVERIKVILNDGEEYIFEPLAESAKLEKVNKETREGEIYKKITGLFEKNRALIHSAKPNVSKNSAGYLLWNVEEGKVFNLAKLFIGSQGTLGIITEITFKLVPRHLHSRLAVIFLKDISRLGEIVHEVLRFVPESFESYDDQTLKLALRFIPDLLKALGLKKAFTLGWRFLPDLQMLLTGGFPKLVLLAEFTGDDEDEIEKRQKEVKRALARFAVPVHLTKSEAEGEKYWTIRRESFNLLRKRVKDRHTAPFIDDVIVRPEYLPEFLPKLQQILEKYKDFMFATIAGHAGDGNFHIIPLMDLRDPRARALIPQIADEVYTLVLSYKGSLTAEHNDGLVRSPYLERMYGKPVIKLFHEVKEIFDPLNIFNPGKKVGASLDYTYKHIIKQ